jgi:DNA-binding response OmpR family regulator
MQGARILLIEDEDVLCDLIVRNLRARNHEVTVAMNVHDALAHLRTAHFDLILLDINLPDKTGWDVLRTAQNEGYLNLQEMEGHAYKLPVVVLSAVRVSPSRLAEFRPLAYLPKPFPMEALLRLAAEAAQRRNANTVQGSENAADYENPQSNEEELHA